MAMAYANANAVSRTLSTISSFSLDKSFHSHPSSSSSSSLAFPHQLVPVGLKTFEGFHCRPSVGCTKILQKSEKLQVEGDRTCRVSVRSAASTAPPLTVPKQKIRIKLRSYWVSLIEQSCKQIMDAARTTNAKTMGPVPLPTKRRIYCVLTSPHVHKDAREHLEMRTHQRLIDIENPNADTIDALMQLDIPAGVDVEVKL